MAAKTTTVRKDLIPYQAGTIILDPLDENKRPDYTRSVATGTDFLTSTQVSITRTTETLENGNGQDKDFITNETYTLTATGNVFNPIFHGVVTGQIETLPEKKLFPYETSYNLPLESNEEGNTFSISFKEPKSIPDAPTPAKDETGVVSFYIEDSYGNVLTRLDAPENGAYSYDDDEEKLEFSEDYAGAFLRIIYSYEVTNSIQYASNPVLKNPEYQVRIFGIRQSASTGDSYNFVETIARATATGDVTGQATQKAKSAPITYTFSSTPVPKGTSVYTAAYAPASDIGAGGDSSVKNIVNGCDDNFSKSH